MSVAVPPPPVWAPLSSSEWYFWFQQIADYIAAITQGKVDIVLPPSTTYSAPLNFTPSSTLKATPAQGDMEYKDPFVYFTTSQGRGYFLFSHSIAAPYKTGSISAFTNNTTYDVDVAVPVGASGSGLWTNPINLIRGGVTVPLALTVGSGSDYSGPVRLSPGDTISSGGSSAAEIWVIPR